MLSDSQPSVDIHLIPVAGNDYNRQESAPLTLLDSKGLYCILEAILAGYPLLWWVSQYKQGDRPSPTMHIHI